MMTMTQYFFSLRSWSVQFKWAKESDQNIDFSWTRFHHCYHARCVLVGRLWLPHPQGWLSNRFHEIMRAPSQQINNWLPPPLVFFQCLNAKCYCINIPAAVNLTTGQLQGSNTWEDYRFLFNAVCTLITFKATLTCCFKFCHIFYLFISKWKD